jgi:hypothetical protein
MVVVPLRTGSTQNTWFPVAPWAMRDAAYELLQQIPDLKKVFKVTPGDIAPEDLPALVMDLQDNASAGGQGNQGAVSFDHRSTLTLAIMCSAGSNLLVDGTVWTLAETVLIQLLRNQDFPREYVEGIERMSMNLRIPRPGETILASLNISLDITTRSEWEPIIPHKLRELMIERRLTTTQTETGLDWDIIY